MIEKFDIGKREGVISDIQTLLMREVNASPQGADSNEVTQSVAQESGFPAIDVAYSLTRLVGTDIRMDHDDKVYPY